MNTGMARRSKNLCQEFLQTQWQRLGSHVLLLIDQPRPQNGISRVERAGNRTVTLNSHHHHLTDKRSL